MKTKYLFLFTVFIFSISLNAQKQDKKETTKPTSIYTFSKLSVDKNGFSALNKRLNLSNYTFVFSDPFNQSLNQFSEDFQYFGKHPLAFNYDYKRSLDRNLSKILVLQNDPTHWNIHCQNPNLN
ncbi:hypothetical protein [uncultured Polaribacter sp.]|uniref:hypothetical protein n=1 Tax=uncultured Polaribacter sp. TaxID=174711 RepID=UPI00261B5E1A|nr:hypothetical protein [uncultured Polaribacter sp.]